jgi:hypothetical protein
MILLTTLVNVSQRDSCLATIRHSLQVLGALLTNTTENLYMRLA